MDPNGKIAARTLYQHYQAWCAENGEKAVSNNKFSAEMVRLGVQKGRDQYNTFYHLSDKQ